MTDFICELFDLTEAAADETPDRHELNAALAECRAQIEAQMGEDFTEEASRLEFERYRSESLSAFRQGFRTAVALMKA